MDTLESVFNYPSEKSLLQEVGENDEVIPTASHAHLLPSKSMFYHFLKFCVCFCVNTVMFEMSSFSSCAFVERVRFFQAQRQDSVTGGQK